MEFAQNEIIIDSKPQQEQNVIQLVDGTPKQPITLTEEEDDRVNYFLSKSVATSTWLDRFKVIKEFLNWYESRYGIKVTKETGLPEDVMVIKAYILHLIDHKKNKRNEPIKFTTIRKILKILKLIYNMQNENLKVNPFHSPAIKEILKGAENDDKENHLGIRQGKSMKAITLDELVQMIDKIDLRTMQGIRDRAILLLTFTTAARRSEITNLTVNNLFFNRTHNCLDIQFYESKKRRYYDKTVKAVTNPDSKKYCPVYAVAKWMYEANIKKGYLFRAIDKGGNISSEKLDDKTIWRIVKKYISLIGLTPNDYGAHSLRSGFVTTAKYMDYSDAVVMQQTGHQSRATLERYNQKIRRHKENASDMMNEASLIKQQHKQSEEGI